MNERAMRRGFASCHLCLKLADVSAHHCPRCGSSLHARKPDSIQRTMALLLTAAVLYIPANVLPIMYTDQLATTSESTIIGGVILLVKLDSIPIAAVIFIASVLVPLGKIVAMFYLCYMITFGSIGSERQLTVLYRITELMGKWSMIDVFVVAVLVALIQLQGLLVFRPGAAALAFGGVVIVTIFAAESFDPRLLWDKLEAERDE